METRRPHARTIPMNCAASQAPCPTCGKRGRRKQVLRRQVRTIAYKQVVLLDITYGEYRARCGCCTTFRTAPPGVDPRATYHDEVRRAVLDRILEDGMSAERVIASMRRDFLLDLSDGFVSDCLDREIRQLDMADHRRWVRERFSGTLCVDELHLGRNTLLPATDPLQDLPVAFALVAGNDKDHMRRFLKNLKAWGLSPEVVVTDGSNLYPAVLAQLWPGARHQLCVFHVLKEIHKLALDAVRRLRRGLSRRGERGRKPRRGRPPKSRAKRRSLSNKEKSAFVFKRRWLIVKRREAKSPQERADLTTMLGYLPELKVLREFVDRPGMLFEPGQGEALAWGRHAALMGTRRFREVPELATALGMLGAERFTKMIAFLKSPACRRVRTNNHVERVNRKLRYEEKSRYKWRSRRTTVRFLVLLLDRHWRRERAIRSRWQEGSPPGGGDRSSPQAAARNRVA
jgi:transposase-like protein